MAGDWTPFEASTLRKPEVLTIASKTGRTRHEVCGLLMELWCWAGEQTVDGHVDAPVDGLPSAVGGDVAFWDAVIDVGWLEGNGAGLFIPNAEKWLTKGAKARLDKTKRQQKWRDKAADVDAGVDKKAPTEPSTTEENSTEENSTVQKKVKKKKQPAAKTTSRKDPHAEVFKAAFDTAFGDDGPYEWTTADFVQLAKWRKSHSRITPEQFVAVARENWTRGEYAPASSMTIKGLAAQWSTLAGWVRNKGKAGGFNQAKTPPGTYDGVATEFE